MCGSACKICKAVLNTSPYDGSFVIYEGDYYCSSCLYAKRTNSRTKKDKWAKDIADEKLATLKKSTEEHFYFQDSKEKLYEYIEQAYMPSYLPASFYAKMNSIFDGSHKGLRIPIPPDDLLDMFQQKAAFLNKNAIKKWGVNQPTPIARINYDLAILMGRYDKYLAWKRSAEIEAQEAVESANERIRTEQYVYVAPQPKVQDELDISSILEDLFD